MIFKDNLPEHFFSNSLVEILFIWKQPEFPFIQKRLNKLWLIIRFLQRRSWLRIY